MRKEKEKWTKRTGSKLSINTRNNRKLYYPHGCLLAAKNFSRDRDFWNSSIIFYYFSLQLQYLNISIQIRLPRFSQNSGMKNSIGGVTKVELMYHENLRQREGFPRLLIGWCFCQNSDLVCDLLKFRRNLGRWLAEINKFLELFCTPKCTPICGNIFFISNREEGWY